MKRFWPDETSALTLTCLTFTGLVPARSTVTFLPSTESTPDVTVPAVVQLLASASSIRLRSCAAWAAASAPLVSPVAAAPLFADA